MVWINNKLVMAMKKLPNQIFIVFFFFVLTAGCRHDYGPELKRAMQLAGSNSKELKKVLHHYSHNPADSLKFRAACFLIENMRWHYGPQIKPSDRFWELFLLEDSLATLRELNPGSVKYKMAVRGYKLVSKKIGIKMAIGESNLDYALRSDLETLESGFIIRNIDAAFEVKGLNWNKNLTFKDFCEYVLPYRFHDEAVYPMRGKLKNYFSRLCHNDSLLNDAHLAISFLNRRLWRLNWEWGDKEAKMPDMGFFDVLFWNTESIRCMNHIVSLGQVMRAVGLPVLELCIPTWRDMNIGHSGCVIPESDGGLTYFSALFQNPGSVHRPHRPELATKMYIKTFSAQLNSAFFLKAPGEFIPEFFNTPCIKDVTEKFLETRNVEIDLYGENSGNNLCWFCVFIRGEWSPVGWGKFNRERGCVRFENLPCGLTGIACKTDLTGRLSPSSRMFTVTDKGVEYVDQSGLSTDLCLLRKFHVKERMLDKGHSIIGTRIQAANCPDFSDAVNLYTINDTLQGYLQDIVFENSASYRYYRLIASSTKLNIAELEFLTEKDYYGLQSATPLPVFTKDGAVKENYYTVCGDTISSEPGSKLFDGDMLTYSEQKWAGMDFSNRVSVQRVRIAPRNAHNGIVRGDHYELFYWNNNWISMGVKQASYNFLTYTGVPSNTLYWLRNLDHGEEEQPFFYKKDKQVFINQPQDDYP